MHAPIKDLTLLNLHVTDDLTILDLWLNSTIKPYLKNDNIKKPKNLVALYHSHSSSVNAIGNFGSKMLLEFYLIHIS